jgi:hypothetical protein
VPFDPKNPRHLAIALALSALSGAAIVQSHHDEAKKSNAEMEDPDGCEWLCETIGDLLDDWEPENCDFEDDYPDDLVEYLRANLHGVEGPGDGRRIKVAKRTKTPFGIPDVCIDDRLVVELKVGPHEGEKDRLIGQCCKYSVEWVTWAIVIDMDEDKQEQLVELLEKKSLNYIEVIPFDTDEDDDDEDEVEDEDDEDDDQ